MKKLQALLVAMAIPAISVSLPVLAESHFEQLSERGAVFTLDNAANGNNVIALTRGYDGRLTVAGHYATHGLGTGKGLGNQGGVILSENHHWLLAVNAGSNEISVFSVRPHGLLLTDKVASGGAKPVSLTIDHDLVYVLNADSDSISGFKFSANGKLTALKDSTRALSGKGTGPAEIKFSPNGRTLIVTEKATNLIDSFVLDRAGLAGNVITNTSAGQTPFGFDISRRGDVVVSEAAGGAVNASSVSSYEIHRNGIAEPISAAVPTTETAACWVAITENSRYAYVANAGSSSVTGYRIERDGALEILNQDGVTGNTGAGTHPTDMALSAGSHYLYVLSSATGSVSAFKVKHHGELEAISGASGLPLTVNGLAAF